MSNREAFERQMRRYRVSMLFLTLDCWVVCIAFLHNSLGLGESWLWASLGSAAALAATVVCGAFCLYRLWRSWNGWPLSLIAFGGFILLAAFLGVCHWLDYTPEILGEFGTWIPGAGWLALASDGGWPSDAARVGWLTFGSVVVAAGALGAFRALRAQFTIWSIHELAEVQETAVHERWEEQHPESEGPADLMDHEWARVPEVELNWLERVSLGVLSDTERDTLHFLTGGAGGWMSRFGLTAFSALAGWLFANDGGGFSPLHFLLLMWTYFALSLRGRCFGLFPVFSAGAGVPLFAFFPVDERAITRVLCKVVYVRACYCLGAFLIWFALFGVMNGGVPAGGIALATKCWAVVFAIIPLVAVVDHALTFSLGRVRVAEFFLSLLAVMLFLAAGGMVLWCLWTDSARSASLSVILLAVISMLEWRLFRLFARSGRVDFLNRSQSEAS